MFLVILALNCEYTAGHVANINVIKIKTNMQMNICSEANQTNTEFKMYFNAYSI